MPSLTPASQHLVLVVGLAAVWAVAPEARAQAPGCDPADVCCSQCDTSGIATCPNDIPFEAYDDLTDQRAEWLGELAADGCGDDLFGTLGLVEGTCLGLNRRFLLQQRLNQSEGHFFDGTGAFLGSGIGGDSLHPVCGLETYYPSRTVCTPVIDTIHCGYFWETFTSEPLQNGGTVGVPGATASSPTPVPSLHPPFGTRLAAGVVLLVGSWVALRRRARD
ncbi:MAG: hypothetical protein AAF430_03740 [Myxococcota bacterium]